MNTQNSLHWPLVIGMSALALVQPFLNLTGWMDLLGRPLVGLLLPLLISAVWLAIVVLGRVSQPLLTLVITALLYGLFGLALGAVLSPVLTGQPSGPFSRPLLLPLAVLYVLGAHGVWGLVTGLIAWGLQELLRTVES